MPDENPIQERPDGHQDAAGGPEPVAATPDPNDVAGVAGGNVTAAAGTAKSGSEAAAGGAEEKDLRTQVVDVLKQCYDPEIPVDIYELGLIYNIDIDEGGNTVIKMTLTSPMCPVAESLPPDVERRVGEVDGIRDVRVDVVWEPTWDKDMMSEVAKLKLNMF